MANRIKDITHKELAKAAPIFLPTPAIKRETMMSDVQIENGFTQIANELLDALIKHKMPGECWRVFLFILRKTYGWHKKFDPISYSQIHYGTGLHIRAIRRAISMLVDMRMIAMRKDAHIHYTTYSIQKDYEKWGLCAKTRICAKRVESYAQRRSEAMRKDAHHKIYITKDSITKEKSVYGDCVALAPDEYLKLCDRYGKPMTDEYIQALNNYMMSKGKRYVSHYHAILTWIRKDSQRAKPKPTPAQVMTYASMQSLASEEVLV